MTASQGSTQGVNAVQQLSFLTYCYRHMAALTR